MAFYPRCKERGGDAIRKSRCLDCFSRLVVGPAVSERTRWLARATVGSALGLAALLGASAGAMAQDYNQFPYSIMTPEPGTASHARVMAPSRARHRKYSQGRALAKPSGRGRFAVRGSSGSVLPTPLPRTSLIPPENRSMPTAHALPQEQGPTFVPSAPGLGPIPNLPHGTETFQDRASRCSFQQGLSNVPGGASTAYMGACVQ